MRDNQLTLQLIRCILIQELCIPGERVVLYNQKFIIPKTGEMRIYLETKLSPKAISNRNRFVGTGYGEEQQDSNWMEEVCIGIYSVDLEALQRKEEVAMALHSIFSQQIQEKNSFKIFRNVNIIPVNEQEGTHRLYRFDIECRVQAWYSKTKVAEFFNSNEVQVYDEGGQPIIIVEFVIPDTNPTVYPKT